MERARLGNSAGAATVATWAFEIIWPHDDDALDAIKVIVPKGKVVTQTYSAEIAARNSPVYPKQKPSVMLVPPGHGFYFSRAVNNGWTDNKKNGQQPLEGWSFDHEHQYIKRAARAQLVSYAGDTWVFYAQSVDWSRGGKQYFPNESNSTWELYWYMNDSMQPDMYDDNEGTANIDIAIFRL